MWSALVLAQWMTALVLTLAAFHWKRTLPLMFLAGLFWITTGYSTVQIDFIGFGSSNVIIYDHELDDWYGDISLFWLLTGVGSILIVYTFYNFIHLFRSDLNEIERHGGENRIFEETKDWKG